MRELHWDEVTLEAAFWTPRRGRLFTLWGAPFAADVCMHRAGFFDFDDSDNDQDSDFEALCTRLLHAMTGYGPPTIQNGEYPTLSRSLVARIWSSLGGVPRNPNPPPTLVNLLLAAARSDEFPPCILEFGDPARASLRVQDGHAIIWIHFAQPESSPADLLATLADGRPLRRTILDWTPLVGLAHGSPKHRRP